MQKVVQLLRIKRFLKLRKRSFIFLPLVFSLFVLQVNGQDILDKKINLNQQGASIKDALLDVQKQSGVKIIYGESINGYPEVKITAKTDNLTVREAIELILKKTNLQYEVTGTHVMISERKTPKPTTNPNANAGQGQQGSGTLKGRIVEFETSQPLPGASIKVVGTSIGGQSNENGYYNLTGIPAGNHTLEVSFIGYQTENISVNVNAGHEATYDVRLQGDNQLEEVTITAIGKTRAPVAHTSERQLISEIKEMRVVASGISSQQISMSADRNAAQAVAKVSGVSIVDDRFVIVRGLNPRYNLTYLNDNVAPATEVYSRAFAMDLIPSRVIDRILVVKSPSPEYQADATGGVIKVYTKDAKTVRHFDIEVQGAFRTGSTFKDMFTHKGGRLDFLGFDDGTRKLPSSVPGYGNINRATISQSTYASTFSPILWHEQRTAMPNAQITANYYNAWRVGGKFLSMLSSLSYKHDEQVFNTYQQQGYGLDQNNTNDEISEDLSGMQVSQFNLLQNFTYKLSDDHSFHFKNFLLQNGTSTNTERISYNHNSYYLYNQLGASDWFKKDKDIILSYNQRFLYAGNLGGTHTFDSKRHDLKWNLGYSYTQQQTPDQRVVRYKQPTPHTATGDADLQWTARIRQGDNSDHTPLLMGSISRTWMSNQDDLYNFSADYTFKLKPWAAVHAGTFQQFKRRHFYRRIYTVNEGDLTGGLYDYITNPGSSGFVDPNLIMFNQQDIRNVWSEAYLREDGTGIKVYDRTAGSDAYVGTEQNNSGYASFSLTPFDRKIEVYGGIRAEYNRQRIGAAVPPTFRVAQIDEINMPILVDYGKLDWFPSVNVSWRPNESWVVRGGYGKTINRPEFRETSPFEEINYDANQLISGNPELRPALVDNYNFRIEFYPDKNQKGEAVNIGIFYKKLDNPIERTVTSDRTGIHSYRLPNSISYSNADNAVVKGLEIEISKKLDFIPLAPFRQLSVIANGSFIQSEVSGEYSRRGGGVRPIDRRLQGQAPFLINAGVYYDNAGSGTKVSIIHNMVGERIYAVAPYFEEDELLDVRPVFRGSLIELPRHLLDASITQRIATGLQAKLAVQNLLDKPVEIAEDFNYTYNYEKLQILRDENSREYMEGDNIASRFNPGRFFQLSLSYSF
jgi:TonB-dependent receptor